MEWEEWCRSVIVLLRRSKVNDALHEIYDRIDRALSNRDFAGVERALAYFAASPQILDEHGVIRLGLLSITKPAKEHLPSRARLAGDHPLSGRFL